QTETMRQALHKWHRSVPKIIVCPYLSQKPVNQSTPSDTKDYDFLYVADGMPHKNHINLIKAWALLAEEGLFPKLRLTLTDRDINLLNHLESMREKYQLRIENQGNLTLEEINSLYLSARALIFPSTVESMGLPLVEASQHGLHIIAAELDYVRDVCHPVETFDPSSPRSISRAVLRFLSIEEAQPKLYSADTFINTALAQDTQEPREASS
ncbi:MAG: glycosyltransferase, partial [Candidatus Thiodiazotropha sp. (ex Notomyrtea botanica)]|nr:glycosyltransferase [Candidatus Thiodiazotropha sp. (ex Notomyrtea botanica)]